VVGARATVDGFVVEHDDTEVGDTLGVFEAKYNGDAPWSEPPAYYRAQVQWAMYVSGLPRAWIAAMHLPFGRPRFAVYEVERDEAMIEELHAAALAFWSENVIGGAVPQIDGSEATRSALTRAYPEHAPGLHVRLDDYADLIEERADLKSDVRQLEARLGEIDNKLLAAFGEAEVGTINGEAVLSLRTTQRAAYEVPASSYRALRAASKRDRVA
jgi:predicted phage-related endonuclease